MKLKGVSPQIVVSCEAKIKEQDEVIQVDFQATFTRLTRTLATTLRRKISDGAEKARELGREYASEDVTSKRKEQIKEELSKLDELSTEMIKEHLISWSMPGDGGEVPFNEENLNIALDHEPYFKALYEGLFAATGQVREDQRQKN